MPTPARTKRTDLKLHPDIDQAFGTDLSRIDDEIVRLQHTRRVILELRNKALRIGREAYCAQQDRAGAPALAVASQQADQLVQRVQDLRGLNNQLAQALQYRHTDLWVTLGPPLPNLKWPDPAAR